MYINTNNTQSIGRTNLLSYPPFVKGDTIKIHLVSKQNDTATYRCQLRRTIDSVEYFTLMIANGAILIPAEQSNLLDPGTWYADVEENLSGQITTLERIIIHIAEDITKVPDMAPDWTEEGSYIVGEVTARRIFIRKADESLVEMSETISNAEAAIQLANTATLLANQKAALADEKATLAGQKTEETDAARIAVLEAGETIEQAEVLRKANESTRQQNEILRQTNTGIAIQNANDATSEALSAKEQVLTAEEAIALAETAREQAETTRGNNETTRQQNETARGTAETGRSNAETGRATAEQARATAETTRTNNETARGTAETGRSNAETGRANAETGRVTAEQGRTEAEQGRVAAEILREAKIVQIESNVDTIEQFLYSRNMYGVEFLKGASDPAAVRWIGGEQFKTNHLILNKFKVAKVKDGAFVGFLNQTNWLKMEDGTDSNIIIDGVTVLDDGSDIMWVNREGIYAIMGGTHPTYERHIVSDSPFTYDGDKAVYFPPMGICVDFSVIKASKQRSIRDNSYVGTGGAGIGGVTYLADGKGCPSASQSRFTYESYARNKNVDNTKNVPYANDFQLDHRLWMSLLFIKFQTKDVHAESLAGGCISANDATPTAATWGTKTGVRVTETGGTFSYYTLASSRFRATSEGTSVNFWVVLNNYRPLLKMFEAQLALSFAKANGIAPDTQFAHDGSTYSYVNIAGSKGIADGEMTARVRKFVTVNFTGYDGVNNVAVENMVIDYVLDQAIVCGKIAGWGNCYVWTSGIDYVCDGSDANRYDGYQTDDIEKMTTDTDVTEKDPGQKFAFEDTYNFIGSRVNSNSYYLQLYDNSLMGKTTGGSLHTGECAYNYMSGTATAGKKARKGAYRGGLAYHSLCAGRSVHAYPAPTYASANLVGGFRVLLIA